MKKDPTTLREDFPLLSKNGQKEPVIYFDTACQSLRPMPVIQAIEHYYTDLAACAGRSMHHLAASVTKEVDAARSIVAKHLGAARKEEIIFTRNTTEGINLVANSLSFHPGDVILITDKEHNSNLIPWQQLVKRDGVLLKVVRSNPDNTFNLDAYERLLEGPVRLVSMGSTSNLDGVSIPATEVIKRAHKHGALVMLDAAQSIPHQDINVRKMEVDFLAFSGHKALGPSGTGVLYGKYGLLDKMKPFLVGGDTVAFSTYDTCEFLPPPARFEAGLQDYAGIMGLGAAIQYLGKIGFDAIVQQELVLNRFLTEETQSVEGIHLVGPQDPALRGGIFSFYIDGIDHHRIALMLDQMARIVVRSGQHCVHSWFHDRKIAGTIRASMYFYNTLTEAESFVSNLKKIRKVL